MPLFKFRVQNRPNLSFDIIQERVGWILYGLWPRVTSNDFQRNLWNSKNFVLKNFQVTKYFCSDWMNLLMRISKINSLYLIDSLSGSNFIVTVFSCRWAGAERPCTQKHASPSDEYFPPNLLNKKILLKNRGKLICGPLNISGLTLTSVKKTSREKLVRTLSLRGSKKSVDYRDGSLLDQYCR